MHKLTAFGFIEDAIVSYPTGHDDRLLCKFKDTKYYHIILRQLLFII